MKVLNDDRIFKPELRHSVGELSELLDRAGNDTPRQPWPDDLVGRLNTCIEQGKLTLYPDMGIRQAWTDIPITTIAGVLDKVRTRILDLALELERQAPTAGQTEAEPADLEKAQTIVTNIIGSTVTNLAVAATNTSQTALPAAGQLDELLSFVQSLGVTGADLDALRDAAGDPDVTQRVERTQSWFGKFVLSPASGSARGCNRRPVGASNRQLPRCAVPQLSRRARRVNTRCRYRSGPEHRSVD